MAYVDPASHDLVQTAGHDLQTSSSPLQEAVIRRLLTERGSCFWDLAYGSTLHELPRLAIRQNMEGELEARARAALEPLRVAGKVRSLTVAATRADRNRMELAVQVLGAHQERVVFTTFVRV